MASKNKPKKEKKKPKKGLPKPLQGTSMPRSVGDLVSKERAP